jgi:hypothetical protein
MFDHCILCAIEGGSRLCFRCIITAKAYDIRHQLWRGTIAEADKSSQSSPTLADQGTVSNRELSERNRSTVSTVPAVST